MALDKKYLDVAFQAASAAVEKKKQQNDDAELVIKGLELKYPNIYSVLDQFESYASYQVRSVVDSETFNIATDVVALGQNDKFIALNFLIQSDENGFTITRDIKNHRNTRLNCAILLSDDFKIENTTTGERVVGLTQEEAALHIAKLFGAAMPHHPVLEEYRKTRSEQPQPPSQG